MPNLIGGIILGYIWQLLLNGVLLYMNRTLTYSSVYGFWGLVILMCWQQIGYMMIIYIAGIQNIPGDLIEAAKIDGATSGQILKNVTIPMVMPSITICTFLTLTNLFKLFDQNLALTNGEPSNMSEAAGAEYFPYILWTYRLGGRRSGESGRILPVGSSDCIDAELADT